MNTPSHGSKVARKDVPAACQWKIQDIYVTQEEWEKACTALKELIAELETCKGSLKDAGILLQALQLRDRMSQEIDKIYAYARLQQDADNSDGKEFWLHFTTQFLLLTLKLLRSRKSNWNS